jgi:hypothetical protein
MSRILNPSQHHDRKEVADVQTVGCRIKPVVCSDNARRSGLVKLLNVRALMQKSTLFENFDELRATLGNGSHGRIST